MKYMGLFAAATLSVVAGSSAFAVWGVKYEVNTGSGWTTAAAIDVSSGPRTVDFRISVYHDGTTLVPTSSGLQLALTPLRLCNSQKISNFGATGSGDNLVSFNHTVATANGKALVHSQAGTDMILGTPNSILSFASKVGYSLIDPHPAIYSVQFYAGQIQVGNAAGFSRTITVTANTFGYPNAGSSSGGAYGASFYVSTMTADNGVAMQPAEVIPAVITVKVPCPGDLDDDGVVGDADFQLFCLAHDLVDCGDPLMPEGCPADLNHDGSVDDADFVIFAEAYDALTCN